MANFCLDNSKVFTRIHDPQISKQIDAAEPTGRQTGRQRQAHTYTAPGRHTFMISLRYRFSVL